MYFQFGRNKSDFEKCEGKYKMQNTKYKIQNIEIKWIIMIVITVIFIIVVGVKIYIVISIVLENYYEISRCYWMITFLIESL